MASNAKDRLTEAVSKKKGKSTSKQIAAYADCKMPTAMITKLRTWTATGVSD
jgi:hypothetical protein